MNLLANADYNYEDGVINYLNMYGGVSDKKQKK